MPKKAGKKTALVCRSCGKKKITTMKKDFKISITTQKAQEKIVVIDKKSKVEMLPKTTVQCPKCDNNEAFWWMQQTRSADEPPTRFYKCTKCNHTWREYQ